MANLEIKNDYMTTPDQLFRYRSASTDFLEAEIEAALRDEIWCTQMDQLNDPFEAHPVQEVQTIKEVSDWNNRFKQAYKNKTITGRDLHDVAQQFGVSRTKVRRTLGDPRATAILEIKNFAKSCRDIRELGSCCSFSEIGTSASMWALYGGNHAGYSQIWVKRSKGQNNTVKSADRLGTVVKVSYQPDRPKVSVTDLSNTVAYVTFKEEKGPINRNQFEQTSFKFAAVKSDEWSREKEWRFVNFNKLGSTYQRIDEYTFAGVVFGLNCSKDVKDILTSKLDGSFPIQRASKSKTSFAIDYNV